MKLLRCKLCRGEMDIINHERAVNKQVKCRQCGYTNDNNSVTERGPGPEVVIIRRRPPQE